MELQSGSRAVKTKDKSSIIIKNQLKKPCNVRNGPLQPLQHRYDRYDGRNGRYTCLGCDTLTGAISASDEWWTKKFERYPDAAKFRHMPLQFAEDLDILFSDAVTTGEWAYTPSSGVMPHTDETLEEFHTPHDAEFHDNDDLKVVHPSELNKKCPSNTDGSSTKINVVESSSATSTQSSSKYPSIAECLAKLESIPGVSPDDELYVWVARLFLRDKRRKCFMTLPTTEVRLRFLKLEIEMEKTTTGYRG
ncbi:L10-interacting MYB domain-containing protein-like [Camellia sinensis]|uniref:L10-interacting MYB domain-containing protein-like n=1 Tax=Camellia sinensis TaxID=4442 RepID=UPI001035984E|nr:L10-interacting MYB domain-containing protein-like [Camellia sinensis]